MKGIISAYSHVCLWLFYKEWVPLLRGNSLNDCLDDLIADFTEQGATNLSYTINVIDQRFSIKCDYQGQTQVEEFKMVPKGEDE